jgi:hypothetical protein
MCPASFPAVAGGVVFCDAFDTDGSGDYGHDSSWPCNGRLLEGDSDPLGLVVLVQFGGGSRSLQARRGAISD